MRFLLPIFTALSLGGSSLGATPLGNLGSANGVAGPDAQAGSGYLLFNPNGLGEKRSTYQPFDALNFSIVVYEAGAWYYFNNESKFPFYSQPGDLLVANLNFSTDTAELLEGENSVIEGIRAGYREGDLVVTPNFWNGQGNPGEFGLTGSEITPNVDPAWWSEGLPVIIPGVSNVDHKAVANLGQAKWMAKRAYDTILAQNPVLAAAILDELVGDPSTHPFSEWEPAVAPNGGDRAALLLGQLKAIAAPFYNQLNQAAPAWLEAEMLKNGTKQPNSHLPWGPDVGLNENRAVANIGQLKALFSLSLSAIKENDLDSDQDGLPDALEQQIIASSGGAYTSLSDINPDDDLDGDYLPNLNEILNGGDPLSPAGGITYSPVQWRDMQDTAVANLGGFGSALVNTYHQNLWRSGALSEQSMPGDGAFTFRFSEEQPWGMVGLNSVSTGHSYSELDYAFYHNSGSQLLQIRENGVTKKTLSVPPASSQLTLRRAGEVVEYLIDGNLVYTSQKPSVEPLFADCCLFSAGGGFERSGQSGFSGGDLDQDTLPDHWELAQVGNLTFLNATSDHDRDSFIAIKECEKGTSPFVPDWDLATPIKWNANAHFTPTFDQTAFSGGIRRDIGGGWNNFVSSSGVISEDGGVEFRVAGPSYVMVGLSSEDSVTAFQEIDYLIYVTGGNYGLIYENGARKRTFTSDRSDTFSLKREGAVVNYYKNGSVFYSSEIPSESPLHPFSCIYNPSHQIDYIAATGLKYTEDTEDADLDGLPLWLETLAGLSDTNPDQDGDTLLDGAEIFTHRSNPFSLDTDRDGLSDEWEGKYFLKLYDPTNTDSDVDNDGLSDLIELQIGTDPTDKDTDDDYVLDGKEYYGN